MAIFWPSMWMSDCGIVAAATALAANEFAARVRVVFFVREVVEFAAEPAAKNPVWPEAINELANFVSRKARGAEYPKLA